MTLDASSSQIIGLNKDFVETKMKNKKAILHNNIQAIQLFKQSQNNSSEGSRNTNGPPQNNSLTNTLNKIISLKESATAEEALTITDQIYLDDQDSLRKTLQNQLSDVESAEKIVKVKEEFLQSPSTIKLEE